MHVKQNFNIYLGCSLRTHTNLLPDGARCWMLRSGGNPRFCGTLQSRISPSQTHMFLCASRSVPSTMWQSGSRISSRNYAFRGPSHPMILHSFPLPYRPLFSRHATYSAASLFAGCQRWRGVPTPRVAGLTPNEGSYVIIWVNHYYTQRDQTIPPSPRRFQYPSSAATIVNAAARRCCRLVKTGPNALLQQKNTCSSRRN
ncbi:hypothetical protein BS47DRAFT_1351977, partial [Hydnum rufescens UP504]